MAWTYADWEEQTTSTAQRTRLIQFRTELRNAMSAKQGMDGAFYDPTTIGLLLEQTDRDLKRLDALVDASNGAAMPRMVSTITPRRAY